MFSWFNFGKKNAFTLHDKVWKSQVAKWGNIENNYWQSSNNIYWVAFFPPAYQMLTQLFGEKQNIWLASALETSLETHKVDVQSIQGICMVEHHPFFSVEDNFLKKIYALNPKISDVYFYVSLEDPIFKKFGGERIISIFEKMGFAENEMIEHSLIQTSIQRAQKKLEIEVKGGEEERKKFLVDWQKMI